MNITICDDEKVCIDVINKLLQPYIERENINIYTYMSGEQFFEECDAVMDIAFLDIEMLDVTGIDIARYLKRMNENTIIFFVTSHMNYVSDTFRVGAFQFLTKPIKQEEFKYDFERAVDKYKSIHKYYTVSWRDKKTYIEFGDILYIEGYNRHLYIRTETHKYECVGSIRKEEKTFIPYGLLKCHQGFIVNINKIRNIECNEIEMINGEKIHVSRHYRDNIMTAFNLYMAGKLL